MERFDNDDLQYVVHDYFDFSEFEDDVALTNSDPLDDSDLDESFQTSNSKTDTSASEARKGKDIQGIPWEKLNYSRQKYRETRLKQYKNYENLSHSREDLDKECLEVQKGKAFYDFQFNTRLVKSTIIHFQQVGSEQLGRALFYGMIGKLSDHI